jgi:hypothetical protein
MRKLSRRAACDTARQNTGALWHCAETAHYITPHRYHVGCCPPMHNLHAPGMGHARAVLSASPAGIAELTR